MEHEYHELHESFAIAIHPHSCYLCNSCSTYITRKNWWTTNYANRPNFSESPFIRIRVIRVIRVQNIFSRVQQIWIKFAWLRNSSLRHSRDCAAQGKPPSQLLFFVGVRHRIYKSTLKSLLFSHDKDAVFPCFVYFCFTKKGCGMAEDWKRSPSYLCTL